MNIAIEPVYTEFRDLTKGIWRVKDASYSFLIVLQDWTKLSVRGFIEVEVELADDKDYMDILLNNVLVENL